MKNYKVGGPIPPTNPGAPGGVSVIDLSDNRTPGLLTSSFRKLGSMLNPFSYYTPEYVNNRNFTSFMERQNNMSTANLSLYPFTEVNPFMSWSEKLSLTIYGESSVSRDLRERLIQAALHEYNNIRVRDISLSTPIASNVGLGVGTPRFDPSALFEDIRFNII